MPPPHDLRRGMDQRQQRRRQIERGHDRQIAAATIAVAIARSRRSGIRHAPVGRDPAAGRARAADLVREAAEQHDQRGQEDRGRRDVRSRGSRP